MKDVLWLGPSFLFGLLVWIAHLQYMAGHDTPFFSHKTPEEKRIQEAQIKLLEKYSEPEKGGAA